MIVDHPTFLYFGRFTKLFKKINSEDEDSTLLDVIKNDNASIPDYDFTNKHLVELLLSKLDEREKKIITMYYGLNGEDLDIKEIAEKLNLN